MTPTVGHIYRVEGWWTGDFAGKCIGLEAMLARFAVETVITGELRAGEHVDVNRYSPKVRMHYLGEGSADDASS